MVNTKVRKKSAKKKKLKLTGRSENNAILLNIISQSRNSV